MRDPLFHRGEVVVTTTTTIIVDGWRDVREGASAEGEVRARVHRVLGQRAVQVVQHEGACVRVGEVRGSATKKDEKEDIEAGSREQPACDAGARNERTRTSTSLSRDPTANDPHPHPRHLAK